MKNQETEKNIMTITNDIKYIGVNDHEVDLFEGQYVVPNGIAYNSYVRISTTSGWPTWPPFWVSASPIIWWFTTWSPTIPPTSTIS